MFQRKLIAYEIMNYESPGRVSVWLGNLQNAEELSKLLDEAEDGLSLFCRSLGADWIDHDPHP